MARELPPTAQLDRFDVSAAQYPDAEHLPDNVCLKLLDSMSEDPPEELHNKYDIVHLRQFIGVIRHGSPLPLLTNALKMLSKELYLSFKGSNLEFLTAEIFAEPGGFIQWDEFDPQRTIAVATQGKSAPNSVKVTELMRKVTTTRYPIDPRF